jgi:hypothetical protein
MPPRRRKATRAIATPATSRGLESVYDRADRLARVADTLRRRIREDDVAPVHAWLFGEVAGADEWAGVCCLLAAAVDPDADYRDLTAWASGYGHIDEVVVERGLAGERVYPTEPEVDEILIQGALRRVPTPVLAAALGVEPRTINRLERELRDTGRIVGPRRNQ